jgi:nitrate/nitrite transporter NarK
MKKVFPILRVLFVLSSFLIGLAMVVSGPTIIMLPFLVVIALVFILMAKIRKSRTSVWEVAADEVLDGGDFLMVRRDGVEECVPLSKIFDVTLSQRSNPLYITLRLVDPGKFGGEIVFLPAMPMLTIDAFGRSRVAENLIARVGRERSQRNSST